MVCRRTMDYLPLVSKKLDNDAALMHLEMKLEVGFSLWLIKM